MTNIILFGICLSIIYLVVTGALGFYLATQRGYRGSIGFLLGAGLPVVGLLVCAFLPPTKTAVLDKAYEAAFISQTEYDKTRHDLTLEVSLTKTKNHK